jgi:hypothetical protein
VPTLTSGDDGATSGLQLQGAALDRAIDALVCQLYSLSVTETSMILSGDIGHYQ